MNIKNQVEQMDAMVLQGAIVDAVKNFFADEAQTSDFSEVRTNDKQQMIEKMEAFTGSIAQVNGIQLHRQIINGLHSNSEFTFDFTMKDGSKILWHEIISRQWNDAGKVIREEYFKA